MKTSDIVGYSYDAEDHCVHCTRLAFDDGYFKFCSEEKDINGIPVDAEDKEGNQINPIFLDNLDDNELCGDCGESLV